MTTATLTDVIKRNLIILIKNSTANSVTGLGSWKQLQGHAPLDVVGPWSWTRGPPLPDGKELPESYFNTISKILEDFF